MAGPFQILQYFWRPTRLAQNLPGKGEAIRNYRPHKGTPRNAAEPGGRPKYGYPALVSSVFWWSPPKFSNIFGAQRPHSQHPDGEGAKYETTDRAQGNRGTLRNLTARLNLDIQPWYPPYFGGSSTNSLIFLAPNTPFQTPDWKRRRNTKLPPEQSDTAEHHGAPRNATQPDEAPKFGYPELKSTIFWRIPSSSLTFLAPATPFPNTQLGKAAGSETTDQTKRRRGTPRNAAGPEGAPKFGYAALESSIFWRIPPKFSNTFGARIPLCQRQYGKGADETTEQTMELRGTPRNLEELLNLGIPPWYPPYFGGSLPNYLIFLAPSAPCPTPTW